MTLLQRTSWLVMAAVAGLLAACYSPDIEDGALKCSSEFECPSGFKCVISSRRCFKEGTGAGGAGGTGGTPGTGGVGGMCGAPYGPFPDCAASSQGSCDPVCQAGCRCGERCTVGDNGSSCRPQGPPFIDVNASCNPREDACRPGLICLGEPRPVCGAHCHRFCRQDADCLGGAKCVSEFDSGSSTYKVCGPPADGCNPTGRAPCAARAGRPTPPFGCYILAAAHSDVTVCDCAGAKTLNQPCTEEHECVPGLECVNIDNQAICRQVCMVGLVAGVLAGGCPDGQVCTAWPGGSKHGFCLR